MRNFGVIVACLLWCNVTGGGYGVIVSNVWMVVDQVIRGGRSQELGFGFSYNLSG